VKRESPAALLWGTENNIAEGDARLGMFADFADSSTPLDPKMRRALGALPPNFEADPEQPAVEPEEPTLPRRSTRISKPALQPTNQKYRVPGAPAAVFVASNQTEGPATILVAMTESELHSITPKSAEQALASSSAKQWLEAMNREKQCHIKNGTFGECWPHGTPCPKVVPAGWVFKIKHRGAPIEEKALAPKQFKARVVIRGQFMKEGLEFNDTFAPVLKPMSLRALFAIATKYGCFLKAGDVETAFLTATMDCEVWVTMR
jgi:hypothetical protein